MNLIKTKKETTNDPNSHLNKIYLHQALKQPTQSIYTPFNITRTKTIKQENNILNEKSLMSPISQLSKNYKRNISELLENTFKAFITYTMSSSIKCDNQHDQTSIS